MGTPKGGGGGRTPDRPQGRKGVIHPDDVLNARQLLAGFDHESLAGLFDVLSDPTRLRIIHLLLRQEMCTSDLAATLGLSDPAVSQHLRVLRNLRIATPRRAGRLVYYSVPSRAVGRVLVHGQRALESQPPPHREAERGTHEQRGRSA